MEPLAVYAPDAELVWTIATIEDGVLSDGHLLRDIDLPADGVPDMTFMAFLHEASILDNLQRRFHKQLPYTRVGDICVSVNPYTWLDIYSTAVQDLYHRYTQRESVAPHVYSVGADAYRCMLQNATNQSILVSGESGSGKTEATKILLSLIARISGSQQKSIIVQRIVDVNPLLESFGNAKTSRNDNSSRFGKFTQLQFDENHALSGSCCLTYLLEKSRVVNQSSVERNYHIFYEIFSSPEETRERLHFQHKQVHDFRYLRNGCIETNSIEGVADSDRFLRVVETLASLGVAGPLREMLEDVLAAILHLGELPFSTSSPTGGAQDACLLQGTTQHEEESIEICCGLLQLDREAFSDALTRRKIEVEGHTVFANLTRQQAEDLRDALAKELYHRVFQWLILIINFSTRPSACDSLAHVGNATPTGRVHDPVPLPTRSISLLDIFGFECFCVNRFEQLCINYANEKLQQKFTQDVFQSVLIEYREEGCDIEAIVYCDNSDVLALIEGPRHSLLACLNEECLVPKATDSGFLSKLKTACAGNAGNTVFSFLPHRPVSFSIKHYAGTVEYSIENMVTKNRDTCAADVLQVMATSRSPMLSTLFGAGTGVLFEGKEQRSDCDDATLAEVLFCGLGSTANKEDGRCCSRTFGSKGASRAAPAQSARRGSGTSFFLSQTLTTKFKNQLASLMETIQHTQVTYVRCVKPNSEKSSTKFDRKMVVEQLRSGGLIEAVKISRSSFPYKLSHSSFLERFALCDTRGKGTSKKQALAMAVQAKVQSLSGDEGDSTPDFYSPLASPVSEARRVQDLLTFLFKKSGDAAAAEELTWACGKTKVFFSAAVQRRLEEARRAELGRSLARLQSLVRCFLQRRRFLRTMTRILILQALARRLLPLRRFKAARQAATLIQTRIRARQARTHFRRLKIDSAATLIQSMFRHSVLRRRYLTSRRAAVVIQSRLRMLRHLRRLPRLLAAAKEKVSLQSQLGEANATVEQLRNEVERLLKGDSGGGDGNMQSQCDEERECFGMALEDLAGHVLARHESRLSAGSLLEQLSQATLAAAEAEALARAIEHIKSELAEAREAAIKLGHEKEILDIEFQSSELSVLELEERLHLAHDEAEGREKVLRDTASEAKSRVKKLEQAAADAKVEFAMLEERAKEEKIELQKRLQELEAERDAALAEAEASIAAASSRAVEQDPSDQLSVIGSSQEDVSFTSAASGGENWRDAPSVWNGAGDCETAVDAEGVTDGDEDDVSAPAADATESVVKIASNKLCDAGSQTEAPVVPTNEVACQSSPKRLSVSFSAIVPKLQLDQIMPSAGNSPPPMSDLTVTTENINVSVEGDVGCGSGGSSDTGTTDSLESDDTSDEDNVKAQKERLASELAILEASAQALSLSMSDVLAGGVGQYISPPPSYLPPPVPTLEQQQQQEEEAEDGNQETLTASADVTLPLPLCLDTPAIATEPPSPARTTAQPGRRTNPLSPLSLNSDPFLSDKPFSPSKLFGSCSSNAGFDFSFGLQSVMLVDPPQLKQGLSKNYPYTYDKENLSGNVDSSSDGASWSVASPSKLGRASQPALDCAEIEKLTNNNRLMQMLKSGISAVVYIKDRNQLTGRQSVVRTLLDTSFEGCLALELDILHTSLRTASIQMNCAIECGGRGCDACDADAKYTAPNTDSHRVAKRIKFGVNELERVSCRRGTTVPSHIPSGRCLVLSVKGKGELNLVTESALLAESFLGAIDTMRKTLRQASSTPASPVKPDPAGPGNSPSRSNRISLSAALLSPTRVQNAFTSFTSIQERARQASLLPEDSSEVSVTIPPYSTSLTDLMPAASGAQGASSSTGTTAFQALAANKRTPPRAASPRVHASPPARGTLPYGTMMHTPLSHYSSAAASENGSTSSPLGQAVSQQMHQHQHQHQQRNAAPRPIALPWLLPATQAEKSPGQGQWQEQGKEQAAGQTKLRGVASIDGASPSKSSPGQSSSQVRVCAEGWMTLLVGGAGRDCAINSSLSDDDAPVGWHRRYVFLEETLSQKEAKGEGQGLTSVATVYTYAIKFGQSNLCLRYKAFCRGEMQLPRDFKASRASFTSWSQSRLHNVQVSDAAGATMLTLQLGAEPDSIRWYDELKSAHEKMN